MRYVLISALFAATLPLAAMAQEATPEVAEAPAEIANGQAFEDWTVRCEALGVNRTRCMLSQKISMRDTNRLLVEMLAFWTDDGKQILVAQVPVGAHLPASFVLQPEGASEEEQLAFIWQACNPQICEAVVLPEQAALDQLTGAERVLAGYRPAVGAEMAVFPISTKGLTEGMAALKPAAETE
jgi:invasion protein IalB